MKTFIAALSFTIIAIAGFSHVPRAQAAGTVTVTASQNPITAGNSVTISWSSSPAAQSCAESGGRGGTGPTGSFSVSPGSTTTYTVTCTWLDPPSAPTGLAAAASSCGTGTINLSWSAASGATSYNILRSTTSGSGYSTIASGVTGTSYASTGLSPGTTYYYVVQAVNSAGASGNSSQASAAAPAVCTYTITASAGSNGSVTPSGATTVSSGNSQSYSITPNTGYSISSVLVDGASQGAVSSYTFSNVNANHTISATFAINTYTVTPSSGANGNISPNTPQSATYGSTKAFTVTPNSGYIASVGGTCGGTLAGATYTTNAVTANCTVIASFSQMTGSLTPASSVCTISAGASSCTSGTLSWTTTNPVGTSAVTNNGSATPSSPSGNNSSSTFTVPYNSAQSGVTTFYLYNNSILLAQATVTTSCASGSAWGGSTCVAFTLPTVATSAVSSITQTSAVSGGTISSNGGATVTVSGIVWGTSSNPTTALSTKTTDGWATGGPWPDTMTGLAAGTTYHVRAYATNSVGTAYGSDVSFATPVAVPGTPTGLAAAAGSCGSGTINVSWNSASGATSYSLKDGSAVIYTGSGASYSHTGLSAGSSHSYTVAASNSSGTSAYSGTVSSTAPAVCPQPDLTADAPTPSAATANVAQTYSATIHNTGTASTGASFSNFFQTATAANGGGTVTDQTSSSMSTLASGGSATATSPSVTFSSAGTYSVRVCADKTNSASSGSIAESDESNNCSSWTNVTVTTAAVPIISISASPTSGLAGTVNPTVTWSVTNSPTSCTASGDWSGSKSASGSQSMGVLSSVKTYTFTLTCVNVGGTSSPASATVVVNPAIPATPTGLTATPNASCGSGTIAVSWTAVSGATSYILQDNSTTVYTGAATSFSHTGLTAGSSHSYKVSASNSSGTSAASSAVAATAPAACPTTNLTAAAPTPTTATTNVAQTFSSTISNTGSTSTGASFSNFFQTATSANGGGTVTDLAPSTMSALAAGGSAPATSPSTTFGAAGTYSVRACADKSNSASAGTITESNEGDNCSTWTNVMVTNMAVPGITISASPSSGTAGSINPTVTWSVTNSPTSCTASGDWSGSKSASGSQSMGVLTTPKIYTFTLSCTNAGGTSSGSTTVSASAPLLPDLTALAPAPSTATAGTGAIYSATIENIGDANTAISFYNFFQTATAADGGGTITDQAAATMSPLQPGDFSTAYSPSVTFPSAGTYSMRVCADKQNSASSGSVAESDESNNCSSWTNVTVSPGVVPAISIFASPTSGTVNVVNPTITWSTTGSPTSCTASGDWSGSKSSSGSQAMGVLTSVKTYTYTLTCTNGAGSSAPTSAIVVVSAVPPTPTATLSSNPSPAVITLGQSVTLTWSSTNATSCSGTNFSTGNAPSGSVSVTPSSLPVTYTVMCTNGTVNSAPSSVTASQAAARKPIYQEPQ